MICQHREGYPQIDSLTTSRRFEHFNRLSQMSSNLPSMSGAEHTLNVELEIEGNLPNVNDSFAEFGELIKSYSTPMDNSPTGRYGLDIPQVTLTAQPSLTASMSSSSSSTATSSAPYNLFQDQAGNPATALNLQMLRLLFKKLCLVV